MPKRKPRSMAKVPEPRPMSERRPMYDPAADLADIERDRRRSEREEEAKMMRISWQELTDLRSRATVIRDLTALITDMDSALDQILTYGFEAH